MGMPPEREEILKQYKKENLKRIPLNVKKEEYERLIMHAQLSGVSVSRYIKNVVKAKMDEEDKEIAKKKEAEEKKKKEEFWRELGSPFGESMEIYARMDRNRHKHTRW